MDFSLSPEQQDAAALARRILVDRCTQPRLRQVETTGTRFDAGLWQELGAAGLLGLHLLAAAASGVTVLPVALSEDHVDVPDPATTTARREEGGWRVTGTKAVVPAATLADLFLVPVDSADGAAVLLVCQGDPGVRVVPQEVNDGDTAGLAAHLTTVAAPSSSGWSRRRWS